MRRISAWAMSTLTVLVLLFSYNTSRSSQSIAAAQARALTSGTTSSAQKALTESSGSGSSGSSGSAGSSGSSGSSGSTSSGKTYTGDEAMTRYGVVQVQITVQNGKLTASQVLQVPWNDRHDQMINSTAVPVYNQEAVSTQSANIDVVSGATITWEGYTQSLQSAIDQAHL